MKLKMVAALMLLVGITGCASNDGKSRSGSNDQAVTSLLPGGALMIGFDLNYDYQVDREELSKGRDKAFESADLNSDGIINVSEFRQWKVKAIGSRSAQPHLVYFDRDFNDRVTQKEFTVGVEKMFNDADSNSDSVVSYQELVKIVSAPVRSRSNAKGSGGRSSDGKKRQGRGQRSNF